MGLFGSESDVSPAIGIRFPVCCLFAESDVRPAIGSLFPFVFLLTSQRLCVVFCFGVRYPNYGSSDSHSR